MGGGLKTVNKKFPHYLDPWHHLASDDPAGILPLVRIPEQPAIKNRIENLM